MVYDFPYVRVNGSSNEKNGFIRIDPKDAKDTLMRFVKSGNCGKNGFTLTIATSR